VLINDIFSSIRLLVSAVGAALEYDKVKEDYARIKATASSKRHSMASASAQDRLAQLRAEHKQRMEVSRLRKEALEQEVSRMPILRPRGTDDLEETQKLVHGLTAEIADLRSTFAPVFPAEKGESSTATSGTCTAQPQARASSAPLEDGEVSPLSDLKDRSDALDRRLDSLAEELSLFATPVDISTQVKSRWANAIQQAVRDATTSGVFQSQTNLTTQDDHASVAAQEVVELIRVNQQDKAQNEELKRDREALEQRCLKVGLPPP
jgi:hypothetical protein